MARILAIDTTARSTHCALLEDGTLLAEASAAASGTAESLADLLLRIDDDLAGALRSVARVAVAVGPGSFTGIRSGIASAQGIAAGLRIPVVGISVLLARLALQPLAGKVLVPFIEASPSEYFTAAFTLERVLDGALTKVRVVRDIDVLAKDALEQRLSELEQISGMPVTALEVGCPGEGAHSPAVALGRAAALFAPHEAEALGMHWQETDRGIGLGALYVKNAQAKTIAERRLASAGKSL